MAVNGLLEGVAAGFYVVAERRHALREARYRRLHRSASEDSSLFSQISIQTNARSLYRNKINAREFYLFIFKIIDLFVKL